MQPKVDVTRSAERGIMPFMAHSHCTGPGTGPRTGPGNGTGNNGFIYYAFNFGVGCIPISPFPVPCSVYEPLVSSPGGLM